ncbi:MAG TPA: 2-hydroxychromene-2-carboxylate isomerase [Candidatus Hydrogenedentes bacterium]|nr:2-hydroxychromene-2-carboxylate isomerase [Candidatus Hydrogenedentota bacterium]
MPVTVDFIFDFASPNAYLTHRVIPEIEERTGATFNYIPCLLGGIFKATGNQAPMLAFANIKGKLDYDRLETARFIAKHKLDKFVFNPHFPVNSLLLVRGAIAVEQDGRLAEYIEVGSCAMWEQGLKMDDPDVFVDTMTNAGFDGADLLNRTKDEAIKATLMDNTTKAVERGTFGIPTFYVGDEMFFGKERLGQIEEEIIAQS